MIPYIGKSVAVPDNNTLTFSQPVISIKSYNLDHG